VARLAAAFCPGRDSAAAGTRTDRRGRSSPASVSRDAICHIILAHVCNKRFFSVKKSSVNVLKIVEHFYQ